MSAQLEPRAAVRRWLAAHARIEAPIEDDTPILEKGILSSLDVVELVLFIESLRGEDVDADSIEPETFASVDALWTGFFAPLAPAEAGSSRIREAS